MAENLYLSNIEPLGATALDPSSTLLVIQGGLEYRAGSQALADMLKNTYGFATSVSVVNQEPKRLTITSGQTSHTPTVDYVRGYVSYFVRLTSALTVSLPAVPTDKADADIGFFFDARQDATGGRNITFNNVTDWYNVDPYNTTNPAELQVNKAANSFSMFSFRLVNGFWFGNYGRAL